MQSFIKKLFSPIIYASFLIPTFWAIILTLAFTDHIGYRPNSELLLESLAVGALIFWFANKALKIIEKPTHSIIGDHFRQSAICYAIILAILIKIVFLDAYYYVGEYYVEIDLKFEVGIILTSFVAIFINAFYLFWFSRRPVAMRPSPAAPVAVKSSLTKIGMSIFIGPALILLLMVVGYYARQMHYRIEYLRMNPPPRVASPNDPPPPADLQSLSGKMSSSTTIDTSGLPSPSPDSVSFTTYTEQLVDETPRPPGAVFVAIHKYLQQGQHLVEITRPPVLKLPEPLIREQLVHYFQLGSIYFALAERDTFNQPRSHDAKQAALLYARSGDQSWQYFFPVEDTNDDENSLLYFWSEGAVLQLLITDIQGAGSGEGTAKWLTSADGGKSWRIAKCFYLSLGDFYEPNQPSKPTFVTTLRRYLKLPLGPYNEQYRFNTSTGNFEQLRQTEVGQEETVIVSECRNFKLPE